VERFGGRHGVTDLLLDAVLAGRTIHYPLIERGQLEAPAFAPAAQELSSVMTPPVISPRRRRHHREGSDMKRLLPVAEAATYVSLSASTLNRLRVSGGGPRYAKLAAKILYDVRDLDLWIENSKRGSTSERVA
jgi:hypothetical protein